MSRIGKVSMNPTRLERPFKTWNKAYINIIVVNDVNGKIFVILIEITEFRTTVTDRGTRIGHFKAVDIESMV